MVYSALCCMSRSWVGCEELQTVFQMWPHQLEQSPFPNLIVDKCMYASRNAVDFILADVEHSARDLTLYPPLPPIPAWNLTAYGNNAQCVVRLSKIKLKSRIARKTGYIPIWLKKERKKKYPPLSFWSWKVSAVWPMPPVRGSAFIQNILPWSDCELTPAQSLENISPRFGIQKDPNVTWHSSQPGDTYILV